MYQAEPLPNVDSYDTDYHVRDVYFYNYSVENIKRAILDHGAVASGIYIDYQYWNYNECAYYCPEIAGNHAVAIVGWDDSFSREKFKDGIRPVNDGAWIVRNSYGDSDPWLGDGYLYVSYEDASLGEIVAFEMVEATNDYMHNYQYDGTASPVFNVSGESGWKCANTFVAQGAKDGCNERLEAVSIDLLSTQVQYQLEIYTGLSPFGDPTEGTLSASQSGVLKDAGCQRIALDTPVMLAPGELFAVVFSFVCDNGEDSAIVTVDTSCNAGWIAFESNMEESQSYIYEPADEEPGWQDLYLDDENFCLRIKAYTNDTDQKADFGLEPAALKLKKGSTAELKAVFTPVDLKRDIVWSSSEESIVAVENGTVAAKEPGTATVTATAGTMTASCEVTVYEEAGAGSGDQETDIPLDQEEKDSEKKEIVMVDVAGRGAQTGDTDGELLAVYSGIVFCAFVYICRRVLCCCRTKK